MPNLLSWSTRWKPRQPRSCWPGWIGTTVVNHPGGNGSLPSWSGGSRTHIRRISMTKVGPVRMGRQTGRRSDSAACRWQWRCWRRRGDVGTRPTPRTGAASIPRPPAECRAARGVLAHLGHPLGAGRWRHRHLEADRGGDQTRPVRAHGPSSRRSSGEFATLRHLQGPGGGVGPRASAPGGQRTQRSGPPRTVADRPIWAEDARIRVPDRGARRRAGRLPRCHDQPVGGVDDPDAPAV